MKFLKELFCNHDWHEWYSGNFADEPGGPRTVHYIHWTCKKCKRHEGDKPDLHEYAEGETAFPEYDYTKVDLAVARNNEIAYKWLSDVNGNKQP